MQRGAEEARAIKVPIMIKFQKNGFNKIERVHGVLSSGVVKT